jgi:hypothetical protein
LILNKYQNSRPQIWKFDGASNFYVLVYFYVLLCTGLSCKKLLENSQITLNISQFFNKCNEDRKEKTYIKQLESSFLCQIFVLNKSNCRGTYT